MCVGLVVRIRSLPPNASALAVEVPVCAVKALTTGGWPYSRATSLGAVIVMSLHFSSSSVGDSELKNQNDSGRGWQVVIYDSYRGPIGQLLMHMHKVSCDQAQMLMHMLYYACFQFDKSNQN